MSSLEKRAWLALWSMCPVYCVYFAIQAWFPSLLPGMLEKIGCLAVIASLHAVVYLAGYTWLKRKERREPLLDDERDRAIDARATRAAYFLQITGMIVVGVVMPFNRSGWDIVNAALLVIVLSETLRYGLIVTGYRRAQLAY